MRPRLLPEPPADLDPLVVVWKKGKPIVRIFDGHYGPTSFWAGNPARFSPFNPGRKRTAVPVLYGAEDFAGALSETVFHDVPVRGDRSIDFCQFSQRLAIDLAPVRDLKLADLSGLGLGRIGAKRVDLIESPSLYYPQTAKWAKAIHDLAAKFDGMQWVSRQYDRSLAVVLFGDRVRSDELRMPAAFIPKALGIGAGREELLELAAQAGILVTGI